MTLPWYGIIPDTGLNFFPQVIYIDSAARQKTGGSDSGFNRFPERHKQSTEPDKDCNQFKNESQDRNEE